MVTAQTTPVRPIALTTAARGGSKGRVRMGKTSPIGRRAAMSGTARERRRASQQCAGESSRDVHHDRATLAMRARPDRIITAASGRAW
jgi:hypothetical protein